MYAGCKDDRGGAVAGEQWALGKVLEYYADYMEELATVEIGQPDGSVKKIVDEDLKQTDRAEAAGRDPEVSAGGSEETGCGGMRHQ